MCMGRLMTSSMRSYGRSLKYRLEKLTRACNGRADKHSSFPFSRPQGHTKGQGNEMPVRAQSVFEGFG